MKIRFLRSCERDLIWYRRYYKEIFVAGARRAEQHMEKSLTLLRSNPFIGRRTEDEGDNMRELLIAHTPFSLIYRVTPQRIEIVRIWDQRGDRPLKWTHQ